MERKTTKCVLNICHRTLPAYIHSFIDDEHWIKSRTRLYYLDLAVSNEKLFKEHFAKFPHRKKKHVISLHIKERRRFHPDDCISVKCDRQTDSSSYSHALPKTDRIGKELFYLFCEKMLVPDRISFSYLSYGKLAVRFMDMATVFKVWKWDTREVTKRYFLCIYPAILEGLLEKKTERPLLLKKFWDYFCRTKNTRLVIFERVPDSDHLEFMLQVANRTRFDFWGIRYGKREFTKRIVLSYISREKFEWVEMLLKYGFALEKGVHYGAHKVRLYRRLFCPIRDHYLHFNWERPICNKFLTWFLASVYVMDHDPKVILPKFIRLCQKLFLSLPHLFQPPRIFLKDLAQVISVRNSETGSEATTPDSRSSLESTVGGIAKAYVDCDFSSDSSEVAPRPLTHLCRHVLRKHWGRNFQLPTGIDDSIDLPTTIKNFLKLEF